MRLLLTLALIIWPSFAFAQIGNRTTKTDDLVSSSRLGKIAKKISNENASTANPLPAQGQTLEQSGLQNNSLASPITNPTTSLSSKGEASGVGMYDWSEDQDRSLDIAGVKIGMSPAKVKHVLTAKGYSLKETTKGPSFEELVKIKREHIKSDYRFQGAIKTLEFKKTFETIEVRFMSMPNHPIVRWVDYKNNDTALTHDKIRHLFMDKYGPDKNRKFKLKRMAGKPAVMRLRDQAKLDIQKTFEWFDQGHDQLLEGQLYSIKTQKSQTINGSIAINGPGMTLTLNAEPDLQTVQNEQIRSQFGESTTTF